MSDRIWGLPARAVQSGGGPDPTTGSRAVPIHQTSSCTLALDRCCSGVTRMPCPVKIPGRGNAL